MDIALDPHPLLALAILGADCPEPLGTAASPEWLVSGLSPAAPAPLTCSDATRDVVRDMLRHGGFKPKGRNKPASEYLLRAALAGELASINPAVDVCNVVSLHSGLPVSVVDRELLAPPLRVGLAVAGQRFVFNPAGQQIDVSGLLCLHDASGPCANAVKDAQRTKTHAGTQKILILVWGAGVIRAHTNQTADWCRSLLERLGAAVEEIACI